MNVVKKVLIVVIILLVIYIILRLLKNRIEIQKKISTENFTLFGSAKDNEISYLKNTSSVSIQNCTHKSYPLREYVIKTAYNTALTGDYVNTDMITYVLERGCRFLDFEVFYIGKTVRDKMGLSSTTYTAQVGYSNDNTFTTLTTLNSIPLDEVLTTVVSNAFSSPCPNTLDPIFINLRIKSNNKDVYKAVAASIDNTIKDKLFVDTSTDNNIFPAIPVTRDTLFSDVAGKVILCVDKTTVRNYKDYTSCDDVKGLCYDLTNYINMETGGEDLNLLKYSEVVDQCVIPISINDDNMTTNVKTMKYVVPNIKNDNLLNPGISNFILKYSAQIPAYRFYKNDRHLRIYEEFFDEHKSAFVPLAIAITYFKKIM
jgi:hypothetical protein